MTTSGRDSVSVIAAVLEGCSLSLVRRSDGSLGLSNTKESLISGCWLNSLLAVVRDRGDSRSLLPEIGYMQGSANLWEWCHRTDVGLGC